MHLKFRDKSTLCNDAFILITRTEKSASVDNTPHEYLLASDIKIALDSVKKITN